MNCATAPSGAGPRPPATPGVYGAWESWAEQQQQHPGAEQSAAANGPNAPGSTSARACVRLCRNRGRRRRRCPAGPRGAQARPTRRARSRARTAQHPAYARGLRRTAPDISSSVLTDIAPVVLRETVDPGPFRASGDTLRPLGRCLGGRGSSRLWKPRRVRGGGGRAEGRERTHGKRRQVATHGSHKQQGAGAGGPVRRAAVRRHGVAVARLAGRTWRAVLGRVGLLSPPSWRSSPRWGWWPTSPSGSTAAGPTCSAGRSGRGVVVDHSADESRRPARVVGDRRVGRGRGAPEVGGRIPGGTGQSAVRRGSRRPRSRVPAAGVLPGAAPRAYVPAAVVLTGYPGTASALVDGSTTRVRRSTWPRRARDAADDPGDAAAHGGAAARHGVRGRPRAARRRSRSSPRTCPRAVRAPTTAWTAGPGGFGVSSATRPAVTAPLKLAMHHPEVYGAGPGSPPTARRTKNAKAFQ